MSAVALARAAAPRFLSPATERAIRLRWERWLPLAARFTRIGAAANVVVDSVAELRERHRTYAIAALAEGLPWATIREHSLDCPTLTDAYRARLVREAVARREPRVRGERTKSAKRSQR